MVDMSWQHNHGIGVRRFDAYPGPTVEMNRLGRNGTFKFIILYKY